MTTTTDSDETIETARIDKANELKLKKAWELALALVIFIFLGSLGGTELLVDKILYPYLTLYITHPLSLSPYRPAKSLPMQAFMLYMSGSGIQIFSMGIVWMLLTSPWSAVAGILKGELGVRMEFSPICKKRGPDVLPYIFQYSNPTNKR